MSNKRKKTYREHRDGKESRSISKITDQFKLSVKPNGSSEFLVHELVALTFIPNPENHPYVEHIDGNIQNNHVNNLRWTAVRPPNYPR